MEEIRLGRYKVSKERPVIVSALGAVPKEGNDLRLIHDASRPAGQGLNAYAIPEKFKLDNIDSALKLITPGSWMGKVDLAKSFRVACIKESCYKATGLKWRFTGDDFYTYMYDTRLPMGACKSPGAFQRLTSSVTRMMQRRGFNNVIVYIDDFFITSSSYEHCSKTLNALINLLTELGFTINWKKVFPSTQLITFLGIEIDSVNQIIRLPNSKVCQLKTELTKWESIGKSASKRQLQQIIGKLSWAAKLIRAARPFLRSLINLSMTVSKPWHRVRLPSAVREDLHFWRTFLASERFNGVEYFIRNRPLPDHTISTDASTSGGAACNEQDWFYSHWESDMPQVADLHINLKELLVVLMALRRWGPTWRNSKIAIYTDNCATMYWVRKGSARNHTAQLWLKEIFLIAVEFNIYISMRRISSKKNVLADAFSRFDNLDYAACAHGIISNKYGIDIASPAYPLFDHMSPHSFTSILQVWQTNNSISWCRN